MLAAAVATMLRGRQPAPMAEIAATAGVGIGTVYRRFATREALLDGLTERSFSLVLAAVHAARVAEGPAIARLERFYDATIAHRDQLVLPMHGGPDTLTTVSRSLQADIRSEITAILDDGRRDRTVRDDITAVDVIQFGALLAQPLPESEQRTRLLQRQKQLHLAGLAPFPHRLKSR